MHILSNASGGQRHRTAGRDPFARLIPQAGQGPAWFVALAGAVVFAVGLLASPVASATPGQQPLPTATVVSEEGSLVYLAADAQGRPRAIVQKPRGDLDALPARVDTASTLARMEIPEQCEVSGLYAAPRGQWVAVQVNCEDGGYVQVVHAVSGQVRGLDADLGQDSLFLNWTPDGNEMIVKVDVISNPRVYRVHVANGRAEQLPVPETTYDVALSQNGRRMLYSLTQGLGYGSETWIADVDGGNARRVLADPTHIVAFARWSPTGERIAYVRMPDSNVPFTVGELWVMDGEGNSPVLLGEADAGHGYEPAWSPDGEQIAFVVRENRDDRAADWRAERLASNVYVADVGERTLAPVTQFDGALTESPVWSPDGAYLAFSSTAGGGPDMWVFDVRGKNLRQATRGANGRHPTWLAGE